ncbi:MAG TPA: isoprenylcysteine carboxylmethyltransferase family protein [Planctomycetota bacterium]|nr:isoprenylcysteine carboxylmethyltransferase family protein [Planctomycetota bacterium]
MLLVGYLWPDAVSITGRVFRVLTAIGVGLLAVGIPSYVAVALYLRSHHRAEGLVTTGPYRRVRHPLYTIGFLFLAPGVVLLLGSWLLLTVPVVMYVAARLLVPVEERALCATFGRAYAEYVVATGAFFPMSPGRPICRKAEEARANTMHEHSGITTPCGVESPEAQCQEDGPA